MGKSTASCFKIISCGSDSVDHDGLQSPESKASSDGRGWSFRKRSARHRVLSNTVISEAPSSANKESPESTAADLQAQPNLTVPEKTSVIQWTEQKNELSAQMDSKLSDIIAAREDDCRADATLDESSIILIQTAIRGYLAQIMLLKQKNAIKLQAAVRGHLVRRHAVGTLRCVQAIVKMQALVRARRDRLFAEGSGDFEKQNKNSGKDNVNPTLLRSRREAKPNGNYTYTTIEKLLSNKFARQLMESTPRTKSINIKCDPLKSDSAWKWLERWMSVSSASNEEPQESGSGAEQHEKENVGHSDSKEDVLVPSDFHSESKDFKSVVGTSAETSENDDNLITYDADNLDLHACSSIPHSSSHHKLQNIDESNSRYEITESGPIELKETDLISKVQPKSLPDKDETGNEQDIPNLKMFSTKLPETEAKKNSRKPSNPAFVAAQSKFEELSSAATSAKLTTLSSDDPGVESSFDKVSVSTDPPFRSREIGLNDTSISNASAVQVAGSECGTELSISSTLDSPERSEAGVNDLEQESKILDATDHPRRRENFGLEANGKSSILGTELSYANINQLESYESVDSAAGECVNSVISADSSPLEKKVEADQSNLQVELRSEASHLVYKSSPEASPGSHMIVPESQTTPSSQVSVKPKKSKGENRESNRKNRSSSPDKRFLPTPNHDSASQSSLEQLQKEHKTGKRRNSFGSAKPDCADQEPRDSSSSNSLPSYMQATESARAKAISNGSPRSSPDVQDKDIFIKNRHSLPGTNGRQGSPRIHRSLSQAQQNAKGNGIQSPQDRKWRR
ncbi:hypothetical protein Pfo_017037 [Paulownia fortunei]|nr:hypothetical protein Pfo_017037 [Paulownia fortunei]